MYGKKYVLLQNIEDILHFHQTEFLPLLINNSHNLEKMCEEINLCFEVINTYIIHNIFSKIATLSILE